MGRVEHMSSDHIVEGNNSDEKDSELVLSLLRFMHENSMLLQEPKTAEIKFIKTISGKTKRIISVDF